MGGRERERKGERKRGTTNPRTFAMRSPFMASSLSFLVLRKASSVLAASFARSFASSSSPSLPSSTPASAWIRTSLTWRLYSRRSR